MVEGVALGKDQDGEGVIASLLERPPAYEHCLAMRHNISPVDQVGFLAHRLCDPCVVFMVVEHVRPLPRLVVPPLEASIQPRKGVAR